LNQTLLRVERMDFEILCHEFFTEQQRNAARRPRAPSEVRGFLKSLAVFAANLVKLACRPLLTAKTKSQC
jgi:hypothetical protein